MPYGRLCLSRRISYIATHWKQLGSIAERVWCTGHRRGPLCDLADRPGAGLLDGRIPVA